MTITLAAVYAPIGFLTGLTGALFKEFALTLAGAVVISGIVALTLSPMMCALLLRREQNPSGLAHRLDQLFERLKGRYQRVLHATLDSRPVVLVFAVIILCLIPVLLKFTQNELAPNEDQGVIFMMSSSPQPANLDYLNAYTDQFTPLFKAFPEYYSSFQINGFNGVQTGIGGFFCSSPGTSANAHRWSYCRWCRPNSWKSAGCRSSASTCRRCPALARACHSSL